MSINRIEEDRERERGGGGGEWRRVSGGSVGTIIRSVLL
jgi:hypothetical protein